MKCDFRLILVEYRLKSPVLRLFYACGAPLNAIGGGDARREGQKLPKVVVLEKAVRLLV